MSVRQARSFRKKPTDAEKRLWSCLRDRRLVGLKLRRQHPLGERTVDFFCADAKLAIELGGSGHFSESRQGLDLDREIALYEKGIRILRFPNSEILENLENILNSIIYVM